MDEVDCELACRTCEGYGEIPPVDGLDSPDVCEACIGTGYDICALANAYREGVGKVERLGLALSAAVNDDNGWRAEAMKVLGMEWDSDQRDPLIGHCRDHLDRLYGLMGLLTDLGYDSTGETAYEDTKALETELLRLTDHDAVRDQLAGAVDRAEVLRRALEMATPSAGWRARCIERAEREWAEARIDAGGQ